MNAKKNTVIKKKSCYFLGLFWMCFQLVTAQNADSYARIDLLKIKLDSLVKTTAGLSQKVDFNIDQVKLTDFVRAMADLHQVNISLENSLEAIKISDNFSDATVADVLVFLCKKHQLTIDFTGNILSLKRVPYVQKPYVTREIPIQYDPLSDRISLELKKDSLALVFKKIVDLTGKNMVYSPGLGAKRLNGYFKDLPFAIALNKIAYANNLEVTQSRDGVSLFEPLEKQQDSPQKSQKNRPARNRNSNFYYKVRDTLTQRLDVDFENTPIETLVQTLGHDLQIDMFTTAPLKEAGKASVKATNISFDLLLEKCLENTDFTYKKQAQVYFFGRKEQLSLRNSVLIPLQHRSIEMMDGHAASRTANTTPLITRNYGNSTESYNSNNASNSYGTSKTSNRNTGQINNNRSASSFSNYGRKSEALVNILPKDVLEDLEIKTDLELNSFVVSGPSQNITRFRNFIKTIDVPVPVILIEVMFVEYTKNTSLATGIDWGIGEEPTSTKGPVFPNTEMSLGATTINKIIGGFDGFETRNLGKVVPNFYANIKALESNGVFHIKSTPKLSTLNGHRANLSIGETTYYVVTNTDYIGSQIPQTSTITNYQAINAEMALSIQPLVSGDGNITLSLNVVQSSFNNNRIDSNAPPGMNSREFSSTIRIKDQDLVILGGLEENTANDSGTGVPFLARIPILKWFFSRRTKEDTKKKLSILIKPTIVY